jgi:uncharacterized coiled-coil protein SlyX
MCFLEESEMRRLVLTVISALFLAPALLLAQETPGEEAPNDMETLKKMVTQQAELIEKLRKELAQTREALDKLKEDSAEKPPVETAPEKNEQNEDTLDGKITGVSQDNKIVVIDLGKSHDLAEGDLFEVTRDGKKMGKIKICRMVDKNISNADVIESTAELLPGDRITRIMKVERKADSRQSTTDEPQSALEKLDRRVTTLEGLYNDLAKQVERLQKSFEDGKAPAAAGSESGTEGSEKTTQLQDAATPKRPVGLQARVASIEDKSVFLWVGTKHGVKEGDTFLIQRGDREIAWLKVVSLIKDMCRTVVVSKNGDIRKDSDIAVLKPIPPK